MLLGYLTYAQVVTVAYPVVPSEVRQAIISKLESEGIWHKAEANGVIRVFRFQKAKLLEVAQVSAEETAPMGRSFAPAPETLPALLANLRAKKIEFKTKQIGGETWIILAPQYEGRAEEIWFSNI